MKHVVLLLSLLLLLTACANPTVRQSTDHASERPPWAAGVTAALVDMPACSFLSETSLLPDGVSVVLGYFYPVSLPIQSCKMFVPAVVEARLYLTGRPAAANRGNHDARLNWHVRGAASFRLRAGEVLPVTLPGAVADGSDLTYLFVGADGGEYDVEYQHKDRAVRLSFPNPMPKMERLWFVDMLGEEQADLQVEWLDDRTVVLSWEGEPSGLQFSPVLDAKGFQVFPTVSSFVPPLPEGD